jgi:hypothetical protein
MHSGRSDSPIEERSLALGRRKAMFTDAGPQASMLPSFHRSAQVRRACAADGLPDELAAGVEVAPARCFVLFCVPQPDATKTDPAASRPSARPKVTAHMIAVSSENSINLKGARLISRLPSGYLPQAFLTGRDCAPVRQSSGIMSLHEIVT